MRTSNTSNLAGSAAALAPCNVQALQVDALQGGFATQATNSNFLVAMTVASSAFSLGRALGTSLFSGALRGVALQGSGFTVGFAAEILSFRGANQILTPGSESWLDGNGIISTATDFLMMKGAGVFCGASSYGVRQGVQALAMVGGEYAGEAMQVREQSGQAFSARFAHALATGVAMDAGGHLTRVGTAGRIDSIQKNLQQQTTFREQSTHSSQTGNAFATQMAANAGHLTTLIERAKHNIHAAIELAQRSEDSAASFGPEHISGIVDAARSQKTVAMALIYLATLRPELFSADHLPGMIEAANHATNESAGNAGVALQRLAAHHPEFFSTAHVSTILENTRFPQIVAGTVLRLLNGRADIFTLDHVAPIIELAKGSSEEEGRALLRLVELKGDLFETAHLPGMLAATANHDSVGEAFVSLLHDRYRTLLNRDAFLELIRIEEARNADRSYLYGFARYRTEFFDAEVLPAVIEAAKTQKVAAAVLYFLSGTYAYLQGFDPIVRPGFTTEHMPALIEAAQSQPLAAQTLSFLARHQRELFTEDHLPGIIEAARAQGEAVDALKYLTYPHRFSFNPNQVPALLEVAIAHPGVKNPAEPDSSLRPAHRVGLLQGNDTTPYALYPLLILLKHRPELREALPLDRLIEGAATPESVGVLLNDLENNHAYLFTADHLPGIIKAARGGCIHTNTALAHFIMQRSPGVTSDHVTQMLAAGKVQALVANSLGHFIHIRPEVFTADHLPAAIELMGQNIDGATIVYGLATKRRELFERTHVASLIAAGKKSKSAAKTLHAVSEARHEIFTRGHFRAIARILYHWLFDNPGPMNG